MGLYYGGMSSLNSKWSEQIKALLNPLKSLWDTGKSVPYDLCQGSSMTALNFVQTIACSHVVCSKRAGKQGGTELKRI